MNSILLKEVNNSINSFIELLRKVMRAEQKHCILLIEELQKKLIQTSSVDEKIMTLLDNGFKILSNEQIYIYEEFIRLSELIRKVAK